MMKVAKYRPTVVKYPYLTSMGYYGAHTDWEVLSPFVQFTKIKQHSYISSTTYESTLQNHVKEG